MTMRVCVCYAYVVMVKLLRDLEPYVLHVW
jgi:hypothetical protein